MQKLVIDGHVPSFLPEGEWDWELVWHDEFDGTQLDESKWAKRTHMMGRRAPHWVEDAYELDGNSNLILKLEKRGDIYCTTQLQTGYNFMDAPSQKFDTVECEGLEIENKSKNFFEWQIGKIEKPKYMKKYGYFECRCKLIKKDGWWSAFWLQSPIQGSTLNPEFSGVEVDIMEQFQAENKVIQHNNHWNGCGCQHETTGKLEVAVEETDDEYHTFAVDWTPDYYRYYVDGKMTWEVKAPHPVSQTEQFILLTTEAKGYRSEDWNDWDNLSKAVGDTFVVDYVRVFERV